MKTELNECFDSILANSTAMLNEKKANFNEELDMIAATQCAAIQDRLESLERMEQEVLSKKSQLMQYRDRVEEDFLQVYTDNHNLFYSSYLSCYS